MSLEILAQEKVWLDKSKYADAERVYYEKQSKNKVEKTSGGSGATTISNTSCAPGKKVLLAEIEKARQILREKVLSIDECESSVIYSRDTESSNTINAINDLKNAFQKLEIRVSVLEGKSSTSSSSNSSPSNQDIEQLQSRLAQLEDRVKSLEIKNAAQSPSKPEEKETPTKNDEDDDVDLFGSESEEETEEAAKLKAQRVAEYSARKSKKPTLIAKSNIILDVKPWDDETDMKELEKAVRQVATDGLLWGASKLVPLAYGIHKLQISCVVEDEKVSIDWLQETLQEIEDFIQSVDIAAFNKI
ncbi:elongation factor 1-delta-like isoform X1 [Myzus persicae]|uniref:elongation factor 1-delta-like isoform X1 n=1 Tax=Myzus persicae TaxID=13164 RepID=UPI000B933388|nr:elongation factor 1-delta-like isoform X1 [Myzus persicae]